MCLLRIAVQAKGRLFEETMALLEESDIKLSTTKRTLLVQSSNFPVEVLFLRDDDIPQSVATGVADLGIVGENEFVEKGEDAEVIKRLGFSKCRLSLAMPKDIDYPGVEWFNGKKIATSYPVILENYTVQPTHKTGGRIKIIFVSFAKLGIFLLIDRITLLTGKNRNTPVIVCVFQRFGYRLIIFIARHIPNLILPVFSLWHQMG